MPKKISTSKQGFYRVTTSFPAGQFERFEKLLRLLNKRRTDVFKKWVADFCEHHKHLEDNRELKGLETPNWEFLAPPKKGE